MTIRSAREHLAWLRAPDGVAELVYEAEPGPVTQLGRHRLLRRPAEPEHPLARAWAALAEARLGPEGLDPPSEAALRRLFAETLPAPGFRAPPPGPLPRAPAPPRPSAAHPRAYRGTTFTPPSPSQPKVDLRPWLRSWATLRERLELEGPDPYLLRHHASDPYGGEGELERLPWPTGALLLPACSGAPWASVRRALLAAEAARRGLEEGLEGPFLALLGGLARRDRDPERLAAWLEGLATLSPSARPLLLACLHELPAPLSQPPLSLPPLSQPPLSLPPLTQPPPSLPPPPSPEALGRLAAACPEADPERLAQAARFLLSGLARGASEAYLLDGVELELPRIGLGRRADPPAGVGSVKVPLLELLSWLDPALHERSRELWLRDLYLMAAELEGFDAWASALGSDPGLSPPLLRALLGLARAAYESETPGPPWGAIREHSPALLEGLSGAPEEARGAILEAARQLLFRLMDEAKAQRSAAPYARWLSLLPLSVHLARLGVRQPAELIGVAHALTSAGSALATEALATEALATEALIALPERTFSAIAEASSRRNKGRRVEKGMRALARGLPTAVLLGWLEEEPAQACELASLLGSLSPERGRAVVERAAHDPLFLRPLEVTLEHARAWHARAEAGQLRWARPALRRALREHLRGERALREGQLAGQLERLRRAWCSFQMDGVEAALFEELGRGLRALPEGPGDTATRHALRALSVAGKHRRSLRRLLMARFAGDLRFIERHPASRAWLSAHPELPEARWLRGIELEGELPGLELPGRGRVRVAFERDPLEALRLGTYFGTCLGLGGLFEDDPAGIVLDINKQVAYARDERGRVLARQLLAISEGGELICYAVYPSKAPAALKALFARFDLELAEALGLPAHDPEDERSEGYEVALILARVFWDDGAWDLAL